MRQKVILKPSRGQELLNFKLRHIIDWPRGSQQTVPAICSPIPPTAVLCINKGMFSVAYCKRFTDADNRRKKQMVGCFSVVSPASNDWA